MLQATGMAKLTFLGLASMHATSAGPRVHWTSHLHRNKSESIFIGSFEGRIKE